jgi:hypothetical protein
MGGLISGDGMKVSRTNELATVWSHYKCVDPNCPGKHRQLRSERDRRAWTDLEHGRKRTRLEPIE